MCVILNIDPDCDFPQDKLDIAADINKHGFGLVWWEKNTIKVERSLIDNDPAAIGKLLADLKGQRRLLHLRHATVGDVSAKNSHPFLGLGDTLGMMHNGTLYSWKPTEKDSTDSDSLRFFKEMIEPLAVMARKFSGPKYLMENMLFRKIILDYIIGDSKIVLFDNLGNTLTFNLKKGKDFPGFWASNDYSFETWHARSSSKAWGSSNSNSNFYQSGNSGTNMGQGMGGGTRSETDLPGDIINPGGSIKHGNIADFFRQAHAQLEAAKKPSSINDRGFECKCVGGWLDACAREGEHVDSIRRKYFMGLSNVERLEAPRQNFTKLAGIDNIFELRTITEGDLSEMCDQFPNAMAAAIVQLLSIIDFERYVNNKRPIPEPDDAIGTTYVA